MGPIINLINKSHYYRRRGSIHLLYSKNIL